MSISPTCRDGIMLSLRTILRMLKYFSKDMSSPSFMFPINIFFIVNNRKNKERHMPEIVKMAIGILSKEIRWKLITCLRHSFTYRNNKMPGYDVDNLEKLFNE